MSFEYDPESHYDRVTDAWTLLLGDDLHYGDYSTGAKDLPAATQALTDRMVAAADCTPGDDVLDVGCGTGGPACYLAAEQSLRVTGITTSGVGVMVARARAAEAQLSDVTRFEQRDGMDNGFADQSFDLAWVLESSHLMRDRARLLQECARVLRPRGRLVLCDIVLRRPMPFEEVRRLRVPLRLLRDVFGDARMEELDTYRDLATEAGLVVDTAVDLTTATRPTFAAWRQNAIDHEASVVEQLGHQGWEQFVDSCDVLEQFWDDGTLGYGLLSARRGH